MINPLDLSGHRYLVTGASSGIGRETSKLISRLGGTLVLVARDEARLHKTLSELDGGDHDIEPKDLARLEDIPNWLKGVSDRKGPISGLVHCAGIQQLAAMRHFDSLSAESLIRINLLSALSMTSAFRRKGVCANPSSIVFVSSIMGLVGKPALATYSASKGALMAMTRCLALELASECIRVNCVAPGLVRTEMSEQLFRKLSPDQQQELSNNHPLGLGEALDVAHAIGFLLSPASRWITGSVMVVDGGYTAH
jgi:NAD(P)-dependent dehydrogenase (short-subunit alcohol dehydrogenase family)